MRGPLTIRVSMRWWLRPYLMSVALVSQLTGLEPEPRKLERRIQRGLVARVCELRATIAA